MKRHLLLAAAIIAATILPAAPAHAANSVTVTHTLYGPNKNLCQEITVTYTNLNETLPDGTWTFRTRARSTEIVPIWARQITLPDGDGDPDSGTFRMTVGGGVTYDWWFPYEHMPSPEFSGVVQYVRACQG